MDFPAHLSSSMSVSLSLSRGKQFLTGNSSWYIIYMT